MRRVHEDYAHDLVFEASSAHDAVMTCGARSAPRSRLEHQPTPWRARTALTVTTEYLDPALRELDNTAIYEVAGGTLLARYDRPRTDALPPEWRDVPRVRQYAWMLDVGEGFRGERQYALLRVGQTPRRWYERSDNATRSGGGTC